MDKILESLAANSPSTVAIIAVVILFLRHLAARDELLRELHRGHEESRKASRLVIEENTRMMGQYLEVSRELQQTLKEVNQGIRSCQGLREDISKIIKH